MAAFWLLGMVVVVALKLADVAAAATVIEAGTVRFVFESLNVTAAPPAGAGWVSVTMQDEDAFGPRLVGLQTSEETNTGATRLMVALAELLL